ncbi:uncharacterized protein knl1 [Eucyclogobius newberryi]|uniref:uncharacterized protein knl1 n=1 Tax=Eucyclogobius newberryi TaxID=166745 RepID=UPI003B5CF3AF
MVFSSEVESQEKTVCFSVDDACMDVTRRHTVKRSSVLDILPDLESLPLSGEKTGMDMTQCLTVNIARDLVPNLTSEPKQESAESLPVQSVDLEFENFFASLSGQNPKEKTTRKLLERQWKEVWKLIHHATHVEMKAYIITWFKQDKPLNREGVYFKHVLLKVDFDGEDPCRERTVRFEANEALMDVTSCHTVHISAELKPDLPFSEKTIRFDVNDAAMDVTQCHTVNIAKELVPSLHEDLVILPKYGEKTVRYNATMDMTRSQTVKIDLPNESFSCVPKHGEKTERFIAAKDETQCHMVNVAKEFVPSLLEDLGNLPKYGEKTVRFNADDDMTRSQIVKIDLPNESFSCVPEHGEKTERFNAAVEETHCLTVNIATEMRPESCLAMTQNYAADPEPQADANISPSSRKKYFPFIVDANVDVTKSLALMINVQPRVIQDWDALPRSEDKTVQFSSDQGVMEVTQCLTSNIGVETQESHLDLSPSITMDDTPALKKREPSIYSNRRSKSLGRNGLSSALKARRSVPWANPLTQASPTTNDDGSVKFAKNGDENENVLSVIEEMSIAEVSLKEEHVANGMNMTEALSVQTQRKTVLELPVNDLSPSAEEQTTKEPTSSCEVEIKSSPTTKVDEQDAVDKPERSPTPVGKDSDAVPSRKSRRLSLADIQSKMRRFSERLSAPGDHFAGNVTIPEPLPEPEAKSGVSVTELQQADEPDANVALVEGENKSDAVYEPFCAPTTPFKLETKRLMSRLSVVGFKPKLTKTSKSEEAKTLDGEAAKTQKIQVQNQVRNFDLDVSDINDEELGSYEADVSETLDSKSLDKASEEGTLFEFELDRELQDKVFCHVNEKKRPLPDDRSVAEDEKRMKTSNETVIMDSQTCTLECDDNLTTPANTQTTNLSNCSHTASLRCEATFESTSMHSLFESSLEDYANDIQKKYDEGTLTMLEFFKLFHINFVIHNPRQSVAPGRVLSDTKSTLLDLSRDRHVSFPKQLVYEADVRNLTEQVERLKVRMQDLDKPLTLLNKTLGEEMEHFSEAEFKSFGAKLKDRHNFYRKTGKANSHEMKESLYAALIQANTEEQTKLRGSIEKADAMLKSLDDAVAELEADLAAIEGGVKSHQEELDEIAEAVGNNKRSTTELEIQRKQSLNKLKRVEDETKELKKHLNMLHTINEWKLEEVTANSFIYTFLYQTLRLELVYEESEGNEEERKIVDISFKHLLEDDSQCHARLVHTLLSQFTQDKRLTKKYCTSKHVPEAIVIMERRVCLCPQLLHDVSLVVSRCRQLGEELRKLKAWGSLRFDILDIHCLHSEIYIAFSSLKTFRKFEVVFSVSQTNQLYALQLKSFKNIIGSTTFQNIEEIAASSTPGQKCLTKMITNIHSSLFC